MRLLVLTCNALLCLQQVRSLGTLNSGLLSDALTCSDFHLREPAPISAMNRCQRCKLQVIPDQSNRNQRFGSELANVSSFLAFKVVCC